jgi:hypothetical protein
MPTEPKAQAQEYRERAQKARRDAEAADSASEQARLNQHANDLDNQAAIAEAHDAESPASTSS